MATAAEQVRALLRLDGHEEDALVDALVGAAIATGEAFLGQVIVRRTMIETIAAGADWRRLAATPVVAVSLVEAVAGDGSAGALASDAYAIDVDAAGDAWVRVTTPGTVRVTLQAGIAAEWDAVPAGIAHGIVRLAAHLFAHRDDDAGTPPVAVAALWRPWRRLRLHGGHAA